MKARGSNPVRAQRATTLVEVVAALGLAVFLVAGVQTLVVRSHQTARRLQADVEQRDRRRLPLEVFRQDLAALPVAGSIELRDGALRLTTLCDLSSGGERIRHAVDVRYAAAGEPGRRVLRRAQRELGVDATWPNGIALTDHLDEVRFDVFDGRTWHASWPSPSGAAARAIRIVLKNTDGQNLHDTVALGPLHWRRHDE